MVSEVTKCETVNAVPVTVPVHPKTPKKRPTFDWLLAQSLYLKGIPTREICRIIGCKDSAFRQQRYRNHWDALRTKVAVIESQQNGQTIEPKAEGSSVAQSIYAGDDVDVWAHRMRRKIMDGAERMLNRVREDDPKAAAILRDAADIVRRVVDRAGGVEPGPPSRAVELGRLREADAE